MVKWRMEDGGWSPYLAGALAGLLAVASAWATTAVLGKTNYLGTSTTFVRAAGFAERTVALERVAGNEYFTREKVQVDWQFMLVIGIFLGALVASVADKSFKLESVPPTWEKRFGSSIGRRAVTAFLGGMVAMIGVRLADGCPSGHGLSGMMQLSVSGLVALACFFGTGIVVARLVYGRGKLNNLLLGLATGFVFGILLQKGRVLRFDKQVGAMRLQDMTILKFMLSAILVGMVGIGLLSDLGVIKISHKAMNVGGVVCGGILFGAGWAVMGFCPGTAVGAVGEGRWHALVAVLGMVAGAALYAELFPVLKTTVLAWKDYGKLGLPAALGLSPWVIIPVFWAGTIALFAWFEKRKL